MSEQIINRLTSIEWELQRLEQRYNGDNDTTCEGNYPQVTYTDETLLTCILKQNDVIRMLTDELDELKRG